MRSPLLAIFLVVLVDILGLTILLPLLPFYAEHFGASPFVVGLLVSTYALCQLVAGPVLGQISDQVGRKPVFIGGVLGCAMMLFPYFMAITTGNAVLILAASVVLSGLIYTAPNAIWPSFYAEMFETRVRYSGTAIGTQLGFLGAGFTPVISQSLLDDGPNGWLPVAMFVAGCCVVSAAAAATARETHEVSIENLGRRIQKA